MSDYKSNKKTEEIEGVSATTDIFKYFELIKDRYDLIESLKKCDTRKNGIFFFVYEFISKENFKSKIKVPDFSWTIEFVSQNEEDAILILAFWVSHGDLGKTYSSGVIVSLDEAFENWSYQKEVISLTGSAFKKF